MLHLDARGGTLSGRSDIRPQDLYVRHHQLTTGATKRGEMAPGTHCDEGSLRQPSLFNAKSMLSILPPLSNDSIATDHKSAKHRKTELVPGVRGFPSLPAPPLPLVKPKPTAASSVEVRPSPSKLHVAWASHHLPDLPTRLIGVDDSGQHPCRSMNGPDRNSMTGTANGGVGSEGRAWLSDVAAVSTATATANSSAAAAAAAVAAGVNQHHLARSSPSVAPPLLPAPGSLFRPPISLATTSNYSPGSPSSRLYAQFSSGLHSSPSYYQSPTGSHGQQLPTTHLPPSLSAYSYFPIPFSPGGYGTPGTTYPPGVHQVGSSTSTSMIARPYPQMESYHSPVVGGMGSHPRSAFLPSQYSNTINAPTTSPNSTTSFTVVPQPTSQRALNPPPSTIASYGQPTLMQYPPSGTELSSSTLSPGRQQKISSSVSSSLSPMPQDLLGRHRSDSVGKSSSPATSTGQPSTLGTDGTGPGTNVFTVDSSTREATHQYRVPSGKEGSLKHRILIRPPDIRIEHSALLAERSPDRCSDHSPRNRTSPKNTKSMVVSPIATSASMPSTPLRSSSHAWRTPPPSATKGTVGAPAGVLRYPPHFLKGSIIQLASGELKSVEDLQSEDFVQSAKLSGDLKIDSSTVVRIEENRDANTCVLGFSVGEQRVQVTVEAALEHPFFVFGQGWSSCFPDRTQKRYNLQCKKLQVGDVCISLTHKDPHSATGPSLPPSCTTSTTATAKPARLNDSSSSTSGTQTHNIETQTAVGIDTRPGDGASSIVQPCFAPRKRRWSAPDKVGDEEGTSRTKLSS